MPRIQWRDLPRALRDHLFERLRDRKITADDLYQLKLWRESEPDAPEGPWFKDFGSFKICGEGKYPKMLLLSGSAGKGQEALSVVRGRRAGPLHCGTLRQCDDTGGEADGAPDDSAARITSRAHADGELFQQHRIDLEVGFVFGVRVGKLKSSGEAVVVVDRRYPLAAGELLLLGKVGRDNAQPERLVAVVKRLKDGAFFSASQRTHLMFWQASMAAEMSCEDRIR